MKLYMNDWSKYCLNPRFVCIITNDIIFKSLTKDIYNAIVLFILKLSGQTIFKFNVYFMHIDQLLYTNMNEHLIEDYEILMIDAMMRL